MNLSNVSGGILEKRINALLDLFVKLVCVY